MSLQPANVGAGNNDTQGGPSHSLIPVSPAPSLTGMLGVASPQGTVTPIGGGAYTPSNADDENTKFLGDPRGRGRYGAVDSSGGRSKP